MKSVLILFNFNFNFDVIVLVDHIFSIIYLGLKKLQVIRKISIFVKKKKVAF